MPDLTTLMVDHQDHCKDTVFQNVLCVQGLEQTDQGFDSWQTSLQCSILAVDEGRNCNLAMITDIP
jgi:hypothetical protein